jgi:glycosyltransferase involved in cell wall biosynthesis
MENHYNGCVSDNTRRGVGISVVTVSFNSGKVIGDNLESVNIQKYGNYEHLIIDGASTDSTLNLIRDFGNPRIRLYSECDDGIYDAMNKGVALARGEILCFLNSDDRFIDGSVLDRVASVFNNEPCDFVWGCISMCDGNWRERRFWRTPKVPIKNHLLFQQIPHPAIFVKKRVLDLMCPAFNCRYSLAADLDQQIRMIYKMNAKGVFVDKCLVQMRLGGVSTNGVSSILRGFTESAHSYNSSFRSGGNIFALLKIVRKIGQWL